MSTPKLILSVDDDVHLSQTLKSALEIKGYEVLVCNDSQKALHLPDKTPPPDLILMDIQMPDIDGYQVCETYQNHPIWSHIPLVFLTANSSTENRLKAFQLGAVGFQDKPINIQNLYQVVDKYIQAGQAWKNDRLPALYTEPLSPVLPNNMSSLIHFLNQKLSLKLSPEQDMITLYQTAEQESLDPEKLAQIIARAAHVPYLSEVTPEEVSLGVLPLPFCQKHHVVPLQDSRGNIAFVVINPFDLELKDLLDRFQNSRFLVASLETLSRALWGKPSPKFVPQEGVFDSFEADFRDAHPDIEEDNLANEALSSEAPPLIKMVNQLIESAYAMNASDIHIEPWQDGVVVRYRIDGKLQVVRKLTPLEVIFPIVARLKIMANLDIAEKRMPQDGRISFEELSFIKTPIDLRFASAPMKYGEKVVMRILDKNKAMMPLDHLGLLPEQVTLYRQAIRAPYGMILHVGPTGSGKSMSLYAALHDLQDPELNIQTIEDPIEYAMYGINQLQVQPEIGLNFARALRSYLRQDPDIILVGEIRDKETAQTAIEAALTGHLLLSTLHTNDAPSTLIRFIEMGIEPFLISSSVQLICAQRLLRRLCPACKYSAPPDTMIQESFELNSDDTVYYAKGCETCRQTGYKGRLGIYELLKPTDKIREALNTTGMSAEKLKALAIKEGFKPMMHQAKTYLREGVTDHHEILRQLI